MHAKKGFIWMEMNTSLTWTAMCSLRLAVCLHRKLFVCHQWHKGGLLSLYFHTNLCSICADTLSLIHVHIHALPLFKRDIMGLKLWILWLYWSLISILMYWIFPFLLVWCLLNVKSKWDGSTRHVCYESCITGRKL